MINVTFYNDKVDPEVVEYQKKVFDLFKIPLLQVKSDDWKGHGGEIDHYLQSIKSSYSDETICIWDIDCIPLLPGVVEHFHKEAELGSIQSVAQKASHIENSIIYASPACVCFSRNMWLFIGGPSFQPVEGKYDCGGLITYAARKHGVTVNLLYPVYVEEPKWPLDGEFMFGPGTNYQNAIYHAFLSRKGEKDRFINKCKEVLTIYEKNIHSSDNAQQATITQYPTEPDQ